VVHALVHNTVFEVTVTLVIVVSSILLAFDNYQASIDDPLWIAVMDFVFAVLFSESLRLQAPLRMYAFTLSPFCRYRNDVEDGGIGREAVFEQRVERF